MAEKTRVNFNAPKSLVERADSVAEILDISRTRLLIDALEDEIAELEADEEFRRRLSDAYYDDRIEYDTVEGVLGREERSERNFCESRSTGHPPNLILRTAFRAMIPFIMAIFLIGWTLVHLNQWMTSHTPEDVGESRRGCRYQRPAESCTPCC